VLLLIPTIRYGLDCLPNYLGAARGSGEVIVEMKYQENGELTVGRVSFSCSVRQGLYDFGTVLIY